MHCYTNFQLRCPVIYNACTYTAMHIEMFFQLKGSYTPQRSEFTEWSMVTTVDILPSSQADTLRACASFNRTTDLKIGVRCLCPHVVLTSQAISCHYANSNCYYIDMKGTTQEGIAKEVVDLAVKILGGKDASEISYQVHTFIYYVCCQFYLL